MRLPQVQSEPTLGGRARASMATHALMKELVQEKSGFFGFTKTTSAPALDARCRRKAAAEDLPAVDDDGEEFQRLERRRRGQYGLSDNEKACFARIRRPQPELFNQAAALAKLSSTTGGSGFGGSMGSRASPSMPLLLETRDRNYSTEKLGEKSKRSTTGTKRRADISVDTSESVRMGPSGLELEEEAVSRILQTMYPSTRAAMTRVGSSVRRSRLGTANRHVATPNSMETTLPAFPSVAATPLNTSTNFNASANMGSTVGSRTPKAAEDRMRGTGMKPLPPAPHPLVALAIALQNVPEGVEPQHFKQILSMLRREVQMKPQDQKVNDPTRTRQPSKSALTPSSKSQDKLSSSNRFYMQPVDESTDSRDKAKQAFKILKNATMVVSKIRSVTEEISKEAKMLAKAAEEFDQGKKQYSVGSTDDATFSLREFRRRAIEASGSLSDYFKTFDGNSNARLDPKEWGHMFKGAGAAGLASYREARIIFELVDLNHDGTISLIEFFTTLEGVAQINDIQALRKRLVCLGYKTSLQVLNVLERDGDVDPARALTLEEFGAALCRIPVVEPEEHRAIFDNVRDRGDPKSKASIYDLMAALASVSPSFLIEEVAEKTITCWQDPGTIWANMGPEWGEGNLEFHTFADRLMRVLGYSAYAAQKACRIFDVEKDGKVSRSELLSAIALVRPTLHLEDFRRKVQQRYRSIEAAFREAFEHLEGEELNNDEDLKLSCDEFAQILETLDLNKRDTNRLFKLADAMETGRLTLYEFFRGIKLLVPGCVVEGIRLQALSRHIRIADTFRNCGVSWTARLDYQSFSDLLQRLELHCEDVDLVFDFFDCRTVGTVSVSEIVAALQSLTPGSKERLVVQERDRKVEKEVRSRLAPLHQTVNDLKHKVKNFLEEEDDEDAEDVQEASPAPPAKRLGSTDRVLAPSLAASQVRSATRTIKTADMNMAMARQTFQRLNATLGNMKPSNEDRHNRVNNGGIVDGLCGYFAPAQTVLNDHAHCLGQSYSRNEWHKKTRNMAATLKRYL
eukprot:TRINITY_DN14828_c0_g1_i2.p1 TRINITY_DN14828_c0_g1~~TRINITY_DN14828_c0_g1_i2.p1  ORF type:complete len:1025 (-),score=171.56 TRINITY_DN14828_c0_g1_i2:188-3262(-)